MPQIFYFLSVIWMLGLAGCTDDDGGGQVDPKTKALAATTGEINYGGDNLKYFVSVSGEQTDTSADDLVQLRIDIYNTTASEVDVVLFAKLVLDSGFTDHTKVEFSFASGSDIWTCSPKSNSHSTPSAVSKIAKVEVSSASQCVAINEQLTFSESFLSTSLSAVELYFLIDGDISSCSSFGGTNALFEFDSTVRNFFELWEVKGKEVTWTKANCKPASMELATPLPPSTSSVSWDIGSSVTRSNPDTYPARLLGSFSSLKAGAEVQLLLDGTLIENSTVLPDTLPCEGLDLAIDETFNISPTSEIMEIRVVMPDSICGDLVSGDTARFVGSVLAEPGAPNYSSGEVMYSIDLRFVHDTEPPLYLLAEATGVGSDLVAEVVGGDLVAPPTRATFVWDTGGPSNTIVVPPEAQSVLPLFPRNASFADTISGLPTGVPINYHFRLFDEFNNVQSTSTAVITLGGGSQ